MGKVVGLGGYYLTMSWARGAQAAQPSGRRQSYACFEAGIHQVDDTFTLTEQKNGHANDVAVQQRL